MPTKIKKFKRTVVDVQLHEGSFTNYERKVGKYGNITYSLSYEIIDRITAALELGHYPEMACASAGIGKAIFMKWLRQGKRDFDRLSILDQNGTPLRDEDYSLHFDLFVRVQRAMFESQNAPLKILNIASNTGDWRAAAFFLERRFPKQWGRKVEQKIEANTTNNNTVQTVIMVPKRAENVDEWNEMVARRKEGNTEVQPLAALPGSSVNEDPIDDNFMSEVLGTT